jgi:hypothetical protein
MPMQEVAKEFSSKRLDHSVEWLASIVGQLVTAESGLGISSQTAAAGRVTFIKEEEINILTELKKPVETHGTFSQSDQSQFSELKDKQSELGKRTQNLKQDLQTLARKTASLGIPLTQSLSQAGAEMKKAAEELGGLKSREAQFSEERALEKLLEGQMALEQAQSAMSEISLQQGGGGSMRGGGQPKVLLRSGGQGSQGTQNGKVKLPRAEDYRPPKEFREDIFCVSRAPLFIRFSLFRLKRPLKKPMGTARIIFLCWKPAEPGVTSCRSASSFWLKESTRKLPKN